MGNVEKIQSVQLTIMKKIDSLCRSNKIDYFILGGSLLGAIRHGGFIPWDDDMDIGMTRENYKKFLDVCKKQLPDYLFVQNYKTDKRTPFYFTKIRMNDTCMKENYIKKLDIHHGIFIDVFPFDNIPSSGIKKAFQYQTVNFLINAFISKETVELSNPNRKNYRLYKALRIMLKMMMFLVPKKMIYFMIDYFSKMYNGKETHELSYVKYKPLRIERQFLLPYSEVLFNDIKLMCPNNPHEYLSFQYGDYMELPSVESRITHDIIELYIKENLNV